MKTWPCLLGLRPSRKWARSIGFLLALTASRGLAGGGWLLTGATVYDGPAHSADIATCVAIASNGDVVVAGDEDGRQWRVRRYDPALARLIGSTDYDGPRRGETGASAVAIADNGDVIVAGYERGVIGGRNWILRRYDPKLTALISSTTYDGSSHANDEASSLALAANGDVVVAGSEATGWCIRRYDPTLTRLVSSIGGSGPRGGFGKPFAVAVAQDASIVVIGQESAGGLPKSGWQWGAVVRRAKPIFVGSTASTGYIEEEDEGRRPWDYVVCRYDSKLTGLIASTAYAASGVRAVIPAGLGIAGNGDVLVLGFEEDVAGRRTIRLRRYDPLLSRLLSSTDYGTRSEAPWLSLATTEDGDVVAVCSERASNFGHVSRATRYDAGLTNALWSVGMSGRIRGITTSANRLVLAGTYVEPDQDNGSDWKLWSFDHLRLVATGSSSGGSAEGRSRAFACLTHQVLNSPSWFCERREGSFGRTVSGRGVWKGLRVYENDYRSVLGFVADGERVKCFYRIGTVSEAMHEYRQAEEEPSILGLSRRCELDLMLLSEARFEYSHGVLDGFAHLDRCLRQSLARAQASNAEWQVCTFRGVTILLARFGEGIVTAYLPSSSWQHLGERALEDSALVGYAMDPWDVTVMRKLYPEGRAVMVAGMSRVGEGECWGIGKNRHAYFVSRIKGHFRSPDRTETAVLYAVSDDSEGRVGNSIAYSVAVVSGDKIFFRHDYGTFHYAEFVLATTRINGSSLDALDVTSRYTTDPITPREYHHLRDLFFVRGGTLKNIMHFGLPIERWQGPCHYRWRTGTAMDDGWRRIELATVECTLGDWMRDGWNADWDELRQATGARVQRTEWRFRGGKYAPQEPVGGQTGGKLFLDLLAGTVGASVLMDSGSLTGIVAMSSSVYAVHHPQAWRGPGAFSFSVSGGAVGKVAVFRYAVRDDGLVLPSTGVMGQKERLAAIERTDHVELWFASSDMTRIWQWGFSPGNFGDCPAFGVQWLPDSSSGPVGIDLRAKRTAVGYEITVAVPIPVHGDSRPRFICFSALDVRDVSSRAQDTMLASSVSYRWNRPESFNILVLDDLSRAGSGGGMVTKYDTSAGILEYYDPSRGKPASRCVVGLKTILSSADGGPVPALEPGRSVHVKYVERRGQDEAVEVSIRSWMVVGTVKEVDAATGTITVEDLGEKTVRIRTNPDTRTQGGNNAPKLEPASLRVGRRIIAYCDRDREGFFATIVVDMR